VALCIGGYQPSLELLAVDLILFLHTLPSLCTYNNSLVIHTELSGSDCLASENASSTLMVW